MMKEREISLIDLIVDILLHWRGVILWMLIGGICFGGLSFVRSYRSANAQNAEKQQTQETLEHAEDVETEIRSLLEKQLTATQIANVNAVVMYEQLYQGRLIHKDNSILMNVDPNNVQKAQITFLIKSDDLERTYNIERAYERIMSNNGLYDYLASEHGMDSTVVSEIVKLDDSKRESMENLAMLGLAVVPAAGDENTDTFCISIVHYDQEWCNALAQSIVDYVETQHRELQQELGKHEVVVLHQSVAAVVDTSVLNQQKSYLNDTITMITSAARLKEAFSSQEMKYYDYLKSISCIQENGSEDEDTRESIESGTELAGLNTPVVPRVSIKYVIVGMVLAAFIYAFILFCGYVLNNKIKYMDDLQELYDLPQLGQVPGKNAKKALGFIDDWIYTLHNRDKRRFALEEAKNLAAVAVKIATRKCGLSEVWLIGCDIKEETLSTCEYIKECLEKEEIKVYVLNNVLYNAESMEKLSDAKGAVLIEKAGSTLYDEIVRELDLLKRQHIEVLGGIVQE